jgi:hypothetical protein
MSNNRRLKSDHYSLHFLTILVKDLTKFVSFFTCNWDFLIYKLIISSFSDLRSQSSQSFFFCAPLFCWFPNHWLAIISHHFSHIFQDRISWILKLSNGLAFFIICNIFHFYTLHRTQMPVFYSLFHCYINFL